MARIGWSSASRVSPAPGVAIIPGLTQLTRMPCGAPSAASCRVNAMTPPFAAVWAARWLVIEPCVATPHTAFYSEQSIAELARLAAENVAAVLAGRRPASVVDREVYG